ncbi:hypothetical protein D9M68_613740 [compost metagenome]
MFDVAEPDVLVQAGLLGQGAKLAQVAWPGVIGGEGHERLVLRGQFRVVEVFVGQQAHVFAPGLDVPVGTAVDALDAHRGIARGAGQ